MGPVSEGHSVGFEQAWGCAGVGAQGGQGLGWSAPGWAVRGRAEPGRQKGQARWSKRIVNNTCFISFNSVHLFYGMDIWYAAEVATRAVPHETAGYG